MPNLMKKKNSNNNNKNNRDRVVVIVNWVGNTPDIKRNAENEE